jgi:hypothetical protein
MVEHHIGAQLRTAATFSSSLPMRSRAPAMRAA